MKRNLFTAFAAALLVLLGGCDSRTEKSDNGGVILSVSDFDGLPIGGSVNTLEAAGCFLQVDEITIQNIPKNPAAGTSALMNVELQSYEVVFTRGDVGTRNPPPYVRGQFAVVPVDGEATISNLPVLDCEQIQNPPLSDLLFENGGVDQETGENVILVNLRLRFFGRTLSGDEVETGIAPFSVQFTP